MHVQRFVSLFLLSGLMVQGKLSVLCVKTI